MRNLISSTLQQKSQFVNRQSTHQPFDLEQWARDDWDKSAAIALFDANVQVVDAMTALDKILISDKLDRINCNGRVAEKYLKKYSHLSDGGWFLPVLNPLADFSDDYWGCLKPVNPRTYQDGIKLKTIKYEHPPGMPVQPFFLRVTARVWERIAQRYGVAMPELLPQTCYGKEFWKWVIANNLPLVITEGVKKAGSLLCAGYVGIGVPGIWNFSDASDKNIPAFKTPLNPQLGLTQQRITESLDQSTKLLTDHSAIKKPLKVLSELIFFAESLGIQVTEIKDLQKKELKEDELIKHGKTVKFLTSLVKFLETAKPGFLARYKNPPTITIAFDSDSKEKAAKDSYNAACRLASKITWQVNENAVVKIAQWHPNLGKGVDDIIVQNGIETLETVLNSALPLKVSKFKKSLRLTYPTLNLNCRYLGQIPELPAKIVAIKSPKNTGKTQTLSQIVSEATKAGKKVVVLTPRIQLGIDLCNRFGIQFLNEITSENDWLEAAYFGLGLCIDSLHPKSKAKIDLTLDDSFDDCIVVFEESEQSINHLLHSSTLKSQRVEVLTQLKSLCQSASKIYLADADMSDLSIDFVRKMADLGQSDVAVIQNDYKFNKSEGWEVFMYQENGPDRLLLECQTRLQQGKRAFLLCSGQQASTLFYAQNLATRLAPYCQGKVLVIDSDNAKDPNHEAYGITSNLGKLGQYQLVISTGVLETGVSIEDDFFDYVFYMGSGVHSVQSVTQFVARYRRPVERHIWIPESAKGIFLKFYGKESLDGIKRDLNNNKKRLESFLKDFDEKLKHSFGLDNPAIDAYCALIARNNIGLKNYR